MRWPLCTGVIVGRREADEALMPTIYSLQLHAVDAGRVGQARTRHRRHRLGAQLLHWSLSHPSTWSPFGMLFEGRVILVCARTVRAYPPIRNTHRTRFRRQRRPCVDGVRCAGPGGQPYTRVRSPLSGPLRFEGLETQRSHRQISRARTKLRDRRGSWPLLAPAWCLSSNRHVQERQNEPTDGMPRQRRVAGH